MSYNAAMRSRFTWPGCPPPSSLALLASGCSRTRMVENDLKLVDVKTGWYDAGIVGGQNKIVPSITLKLENVSGEIISRRAGVRPCSAAPTRTRRGASTSCAPSAPMASTRARPAAPLVLRSTLGYTGAQSRSQMLQNREFVDAKVNVFGKHGSRTWVKMGEIHGRAPPAHSGE